MKLGVFANTEFIEAINDLVSRDLPISTAYKMSKIHQKLAEENERFNKLRRDIVLKNCRLDENGDPDVDNEGNVKIKEENLKKVNEELTELSLIDFEIEKISIKELGNISISPKSLSIISEMLTD